MEAIVNILVNTVHGTQSFSFGVEESNVPLVLGLANTQVGMARQYLLEGERGLPNLSYLVFPPATTEQAINEFLAMQ